MVDERIKKQGYNTLDDILLVTIDPTEKIMVYKKNKDLKPYNILE